MTSVQDTSTCNATTTASAVEPSESDRTGVSYSKVRRDVDGVGNEIFTIKDGTDLSSFPFTSEPRIFRANGRASRPLPEGIRTVYESDLLSVYVNSACVHKCPAIRDDFVVEGSAVVVVVEGRSAIFVKDSSRDYFTVPGGSKEPGESYAEAAIRECREETGIDIEPSALVGPIFETKSYAMYYGSRFPVETRWFYAEVTRNDVSKANETPVPPGEIERIVEVPFDRRGTEPEIVESQIFSKESCHGAIAWLCWCLNAIPKVPGFAGLSFYSIRPKRPKSQYMREYHDVESGLGFGDALFDDYNSITICSNKGGKGGEDKQKKDEEKGENADEDGRKHAPLGDIFTTITMLSGSEGFCGGIEVMSRSDVSPGAADAIADVDPRSGISLELGAIVGIIARCLNCVNALPYVDDWKLLAGSATSRNNDVR